MRDAGALWGNPLVPLLLGEAWHPGGAALTQELLDLAGVRAGQRVLDAGCGRGASVHLLADRGCEAVGLDANPANARTAARGACGARAAFCAARATPLPFRDATFDAVVSECALCVFGDRAGFLGEAWRVLRPGGVLALADVTLEAPRGSFAGAAGFAACLGGAVPRAELVAAVEAAGLERARAWDRSDALTDLWVRLGAAVDLPRLARDAAPLLRRLGFGDAPALVRDVEEALGAGDLGYMLLVARRPVEPVG